MGEFLDKGLNEELPGQTPLDADERAELIPKHIQLRSELNEFEADRKDFKDLIRFAYS